MVKIKLLLDGMQIRKYKLIYYLYYNQGSEVSIAMLSELFQVSKKTILADIFELGKKNNSLDDRTFITIKVVKSNVEFKFSNKASILEIRQNFFEQSITFKLLNSFYRQSTFKLMDFSSRYYYSLSVVYKKINELKTNLKSYGLAIQSEHGETFLVGDEEKKRIFYSELYYYVYGDRAFFLDPEKKIAQSYFEQIETKKMLNNTHFQKSKKVELCILIAVSLQRMENFPLKKKKKTNFTINLLMEQRGLLLLTETYPHFSKVQLKLEHQWMISLISDEVDPYLSIKESSLFYEGLSRIATIFQFCLTSQEGKTFKRMMLMYYKEKKRHKKSSSLSLLSFINGPIVDISSNLFLETLIKENRKEEFDYLIYPLSIEECANILKISGIGIKKLKLTFIGEYPAEWEMFLYRKIVTLELEQFYEWSANLSKADIIVADNWYPFIGRKKLLLMSPLPSDGEIKKIQNQLINHLNQFFEV